MSAAVAIGGLAAAGTYLLLQRGLIRTVIGLVLLEHAVNILLATIRSTDRSAVPVAPFDGPPADPLGQAFALTAIVIGLATTVFLVALALRHARAHRSDDVEAETSEQEEPPVEEEAGADGPGRRS